MVEDYAEALVPELVPDPGLAAAREAAVAELATDPVAVRVVEATARRMTGGMLCADEFGQELWIRIIERVRASWDPAKAPARAWVLVHLDRWSISLWRSLVAAAKRQPVPVGVLPEIEREPDEEPRNPGLAQLDVAILRAGLGPAERRHLDLRLAWGAVDGSHQAVADALGISRRQEGRRWSALLKLLHARALSVPGLRQGPGPATTSDAGSASA